MNKMIATIALVAATSLAGSAASAQVGTYPGGLPGDIAIVGSSGPGAYPGHWSYGGPNAAPTNLPVAVLDAQRAAIWGGFGTRGIWGGDGRRSGTDRRVREEVLRRGDDAVVLRRLEP